MVFEPFWLRPVKVLAVILLLITAYAWVSADEWELEFQEDSRPKPLLVQKPVEPPHLDEPEVSLPVAAEEPEPVFIPAPTLANTAKRAVVKSKKKIRRALNRPERSAQ